MAGEVMLINPRRRHRRRKKARATTRRKRSHRRRYQAKRNPANPRRRRRRSHARRRRNPRGVAAPFKLAGIDIGAMALGAAGFVGSEIGAGYLAKMLPADWATQPLGKLAVKAAVGFGVPMLAKQFTLGPAAAWNKVMVGSGIAIAADLITTYLLPMLPGIGDYEYDQLSDYEQGLLSGDAPESLYAGGVYG